MKSLLTIDARLTTAEPYSSESSFLHPFSPCMGDSFPPMPAAGRACVAASGPPQGRTSRPAGPVVRWAAGASVGDASVCGSTCRGVAAAQMSLPWSRLTSHLPTVDVSGVLMATSCEHAADSLPAHGSTGMASADAWREDGRWMTQLPAWTGEVSDLVMEAQLIAKRAVTADGVVTGDEHALIDALVAVQVRLEAVHAEINAVTSTLRNGQRPRRLLRALETCDGGPRAA